MYRRVTGGYAVAPPALKQLLMLGNAEIPLVSCATASLMRRQECILCWGSALLRKLRKLLWGGKEPPTVRAILVRQTGGFVSKVCTLVAVGPPPSNLQDVPGACLI